MLKLTYIKEVVIVELGDIRMVKEDEMKEIIYNQTDIEHIIAERLDIPKKQVKLIIDELWDVVQGEVEDGVVVRFQGVGRFYLSERGERPARNMHTGEDIIIGEHKALRFSPSRTYAKRLRERTEIKPNN